MQSGSSPDFVVRIVFDTHIVISALVFGRRLAWLRSAWADGHAIPLVCRETAAELLRVLAYPKFRLDQSARENLLQDYLPFAEIVHLPADRAPLPVVCRDRDDAVFLQLAIFAGADGLVSGDTHLVELQEFAPVPILALDAFRDRLTRPPAAQSPSSSAKFDRSTPS